MIKGFVFDLDGVIVDTAKYHYLAWKQLAAGLGFDFPLCHNRHLKGVSRMDSLEVVLRVGNLSHLTQPEKQSLADRKNSAYLEMIDGIGEEAVLPGVRAFLLRLKREGYCVSLGSASKSGEMILKKLGLLPLFDAVVDGRLVSKAKPDPEVFLTAAKALSLPPNACIVVEDAGAGIAAAKAAGMRCIGIGDVAELAGADWLFSDTAKLETFDLTVI